MKKILEAILGEPGANIIYPLIKQEDYLTLYTAILNCCSNGLTSGARLSKQQEIIIINGLIKRMKEVAPHENAAIEFIRCGLEYVLEKRN